MVPAGAGVPVADRCQFEHDGTCHIRDGTRFVVFGIALYAAQWHHAVVLVRRLDGHWVHCVKFV